jgi:hypothetical protein
VNDTNHFESVLLLDQLKIYYHRCAKPVILAFTMWRTDVARKEPATDDLDIAFRCASFVLNSHVGTSTFMLWRCNHFTMEPDDLTSIFFVSAYAYHLLE